jgi:hypothetical protein
MLKQVASASTATGANVPAPATNGHPRADSKRELIDSLRVTDGRVSVTALLRYPSPAGITSSDKDVERDPHG